VLSSIDEADAWAPVRIFTFCAALTAVITSAPRERASNNGLLEHNAGLHGSYTLSRRPVTLVFAQYFETITDAIAAERQVKRWSRAKKGGDDQR
jgi:putative endonuclease